MSDKMKKLTINAVMIAMCAVLGYTSLDFGSLKITFESLPILLSAFLFGPVDGMIVGGMGTFIYQMLRYGFSATTLIWMLPYVVCGLMAGIWAKKYDFKMTGRQVMAAVIACELVITILNTGAIYIYSHIYGYYTPALILGGLLPRFAICIGKAIAFGLVLPAIIKPVRSNLAA